MPKSKTAPVSLADLESQMADLRTQCHTLALRYAEALAHFRYYSIEKAIYHEPFYAIYNELAEAHDALAQLNLQHMIETQRLALASR